MFAGRNAKTADLAALKQAHAMAAGGHMREDIWRKTGWFRGAGKKWRFEIPDDKLDISRLGKPYFRECKLGSFYVEKEKIQPFRGFVQR